MKKLILIIGDDRMGRKAIRHISSAFPNIKIYRNRSGSPLRVLKLLKKNIISLPALINMLWAELQRPNLTVSGLPLLSNDQEVRVILKNENPDEVICFRAGVILTKRTLSCETHFLNLHYADLPKWGGLGAIHEALKAGAYDQHACLHEIWEKIDTGEVYQREPYKLDPSLSYKANEDIAFEAGLTLLQKYVSEALS